MRKYISVLLGCFLMAVLLIPGAYSLWRKDINAIGTVEISVDKSEKTNGLVDADKPEEADEAEEKNTVELENEEKVEEAVEAKEN